MGTLRVELFHRTTAKATEQPLTVVRLASSLRPPAGSIHIFSP